MTIRMIHEHVCKSSFEEFNSIIREILDITGSGEQVKVERAAALGKVQQDYLDILMNLTLEKTNIKNILEDRRHSLKPQNIEKALEGLGRYRKDQMIYQKFLDHLNHELRGKASNFSFIVVLNLEFPLEGYRRDLEHKRDLEMVLQTFHLELCSPRTLKYLTQKGTELHEDEAVKANVGEALKLIEDFPEVLRVDVRARDVDYAHETAKNRVESFLGYTSFIKSRQEKNYFRSQAKSHEKKDFKSRDKVHENNNFKATEKNYFKSHDKEPENTDFKAPERNDFKDFSLNRLEHGVLLVLEDDRMFWTPQDVGEAVKERFVCSKEYMDIKSFEAMVAVTESNLHPIETKSLRNILCRSFALYHSACRERTLDYSFLKFWILSEQLLKAPSAKTDREILRIMKAFCNEHLAGRIDFLYAKRNDMVHRGKLAEVSQNDRDLAKLIADTLLNNALLKMKRFQNKKQYDHYLLSMMISRV